MSHFPQKLGNLSQPVTNILLMGLARVRTSATQGIEAISVDVEVSTQHGEPKFNIIGLADNAVKEARDRVLAALKHCGFSVPSVVLVNLAPAEVRKEGSSFDLAIAVGVLAASGQVKTERLHSMTMHGELSLTGNVRPVRGVVNLALQALTQGSKRIVVPKDNVREANLIKEIEVSGVQNLIELVGFLNGALPLTNGEAQRQETARPDPQLRGLSEVVGQDSAKRGLMIAASGAHNLLMIGPPGCGKSMLAERLPSLLPPLTQKEVLEVVRIYSAVGLPCARFLSGERPYRNPHHIISEAGLTGGGSIPRPGEMSLAHRGVLFLDEFPEYKRSVVEALRGPLESGQLSIARAKTTLSFPARFQLLAAMNPCPCGRLGSRLNCICGRNAVHAYLKKLSEPILDRIDLQIELEAVPLETITKSHAGCRLQDEKDRNLVLLARDKQECRQGKSNAELSPQEISKLIKFSNSALRLLEVIGKKNALSARSYFRLLRVSLTIADLEAKHEVNDQHISEALSLRGLERIRAYCE